MAISIRNPIAEKLAREVAKESGESLTQSIIHSLEERLEKLQGRREPQNLLQEIIEIGNRCAALPDIDQRTSDEILGYNENGY